MTDLSPDLRDLTTYCKFLQLNLHESFDTTITAKDRSQRNREFEQALRGSSLASFTDLSLAHAVAQVSSFKEVEAPLALQKDSSFRSMSRILGSLAFKAIEQSSSTGCYVHLTHIFYADFGPDRVVSKNTFYGYKNAVTRYALKRIADLLPHMPPNVDKEEVSQSFQKMMLVKQPSSAQVFFNVDIAVDLRAANVDNFQTHKLTEALLDFERYSIVEADPKLTVYPWFSKRRFRTRNGVEPMLTKAEFVELAECIRFICHYPPDLKFERRGLAGKKRTREFVFDEVFNDGLLLNAPKPQFSSSKTSKRSFDRADEETKTAVSKGNKRLASTAFNPSAFWIDVESRVKDQGLKEVIATQLITGCRPAEIVDGVMVSTEPTSEPGSLGRLHFTIFGAKTKSPAAATEMASIQEEDYRKFLASSSFATNSKIRGQFYHTESHEVFPQFLERVWLYNLLSDRSSEMIDRDSVSAANHLLEKVCHFRKMPKTASIPPEILEVSPTEERRIRQQLASKNGTIPITNDDVAAEVRKLNGDAFVDHTLADGISSSHTEDFEQFVMAELNRIKDAKTAGIIRLVSPYQTSRVVRFQFLPQRASYPLMAAFDGIPFIPSNVDNVLNVQTATLERIFLRNEFSEYDLDLIRVPQARRHLIDPYDFARLQSERAAYIESAVIQLGKRYKAAAASGSIEPTPYVARHKLLSDLKGFKDVAGRPLLSREDIARKAGHASTSSQTGYGKAVFADKGSRNRGKGLRDITSAQDVKNPKSTAGKRLYAPNQGGFKPPEPKYEPRD